MSMPKIDVVVFLFFWLLQSNTNKQNEHDASALEGNLQDLSITHGARGKTNPDKHALGGWREKKEGNGVAAQ